MTLPDTIPARVPLTTVPSGNANVTVDPPEKYLDKVDQAIAETKDEHTTKRGVVLRIKPVPNMLIMEAQKHKIPPQVPTFFNEEKQTQEENPLHPDYVEAMRQYQADLGMIGVTAMLAFGTELISKPADIQGPEDTEWSDDLNEIFHIVAPTSRKARYAFWLRCYVLTDPEFGEVIDAVAKKSGRVTEEAAAEAADNFPTEPERGEPDGSVSQT